MTNADIVRQIGRQIPMTDQQADDIYERAQAYAALVSEKIGRERALCVHDYVFAEKQRLVQA